MTTNLTTAYAYNADGKLLTLTVRNGVTGDQVTRFVYGTTLADSGVASNELLRVKICPDSDDTADPLGDGNDWIYDRLEYGYNRLGEMTGAKDQAGTIHAYAYDKLGRLVHDRVTALGSGVDNGVLRISRQYEVRGMLSKVTSYDNATVGSGSVVNEVAMSYNEFAQLVTDQQAHSGSVGSGTLAVSYGYEDGSDNTTRPTAIRYPDGRQLDYDYGTPGGMDDALSRISGIEEHSSGITLVDYSRLGMNQVVDLNYPQPGLEETYVKQGTEPVGDGGDQYTGLDRYGRVEEIRWLKQGDRCPLQIGGYEQAGGGHEYLKGQISEVLVYNSALTDEQVQSVIDYLNTKYGTEGGTAELPSINGCVLWLKADGITGVSDGGAVSFWPDASGSGNNASQTTSSKQFIYRATGGPNGHPTCESDGVNDLMNIASNSSLQFGTMTIFAMAQGLGSGVGNGWVAMKPSSASWMWGLAVQMYGSSQCPCLSLHTGGAWRDYNYNTNTPAGFNLLASRYDGTEANHWLNGVADGTLGGNGDIDTISDVDIERIQHGYDWAGNRLWRKNVVAGSGQDEFYGYDGLYQLTALQRGTLNTGRTGIAGTPGKEEDFDYDPTGNWENYLVMIAGAVSLDQDRVHNQGNETWQIDGSDATVACDPAGNMVRMPKVGEWATAQHLTWDAWNRLVKVSEGEPVAEYAYDGLFRRTVKTEFESGQGHERHFYYSSHWQVVEERGSETGGVQQHFIWGLLGVDDLVLRDQAATPLPPRLYALHDTMHVTAITDAAGTVLERYGYDAFGGTRVMDASFNDRSGSDYHWETRFCGYRWDGETGLYQVRYRYLHSGLGRWLSRDPEEEGIGCGIEFDGALYRYVNNNPTTLVDKDGRFVLVLVAGGVALSAAEVILLALAAAVALCGMSADCRAALLRAVSAALAVVASAADTICNMRCKFDDHPPDHYFYMFRWGIPPWKKCWMKHLQMNCWIQHVKASEFFIQRLPYGPCYKYRNANPPDTH